MIGCNPAYIHKTHDFPEPVNTRNHPIEYQEKKTYSTVGGVHADNEFNCARMNDFQMINDSTFRVVVSPENTPINHSAYFGFRIWSDTARSIDLEIQYTEHTHRYWPKLSKDGNEWYKLDSIRFDTLKADSIATLRLDIDEEKLWVCGQEIYDSEKIRAWAEKQAERPDTRFSVVGKSKLDRDLMHLDIYDGDPAKRPTIVVIGRQHPPEVPGYLAMESFVETILMDNPISNDFRKKFRVLVYPLMNPDGVDLGHWRHNAGGIDLNRDWGYYYQEETSDVTKHIVSTVKESKNDVWLGLDFHSTQKDLYYTFTKDLKSSIFNFKDYWLEGINQAFPDYTPDDQPYALNQPISKGWFLVQFNAESITYEIGDETPRDFVRAKGSVAAMEMMKLLILR